MAVAATASRSLNWTLTPFLYPGFRVLPLVQRRYLSVSQTSPSSGDHEAAAPLESLESRPSPLPPSEDVLNNYSSTPFADTCTLTLSAGAGGHGCISFLRDIHISSGPPNGGDGGTGGSIYIQATSSQTSLHKLARRRHISAGRGRNGQGKGRGGERGADTVIEVPVGTIVREISRYDPISEAEAEARRVRMLANTMAAKEEDNEDEGSIDSAMSSDRKKWLLYPGALPSTIATEMPRAPKPRRTALHAAEPPKPLHLDLATPMGTPLLLAAGAAGGLGNPHFMTRAFPRPKYATRGEEGTKVEVLLELKLLADVGLVGKPNAGKSTLLRSITKSRARVGDWAFTTLKPNVGTVVIDDGRGWISPLPPSPTSPSPSSSSEEPHTLPAQRREDQRTHLSIADIPGLIHDAHLDKGLGISFLRHVERARVLAFVVDLSASDAIESVQSLWREVSMYEALSGMVAREGEDVEWTPISDENDGRALGTGGGDFVVPPGARTRAGRGREGGIADKPWFVVATKADLDGTRENFERLKTWLRAVSDGTGSVVGSSSGLLPRGKETQRDKKRWKGDVGLFPVSAIRGEGVDRIVAWTRGLLEL
jgi:GTP-binding protein